MLVLTDIQLTGIFLFPIALIGVICNWTVVYALLKWKSFKHSFGYLSANQAIGDAVHSTTFLIYFCPMVITDNTILKTHAKHIGFLLFFCYELSVTTHFFISFNRFFAVFSPVRYKLWFTTARTKYIIVFIWIITATLTIPSAEIYCNVDYDDKTGFLFFTHSPLCDAIGWYLDFCKNFVTIIGIMIIDIITVIKVRMINNKIRSSMDTEMSDRISQREINFLRQTVFQGVIFTMELTTYFMLPPYLTSKWAIFFSTSFAWVSVHACDGIVTMICNPEFKQHFATCGRYADPYSVHPTQGSTHITSQTER